VLLSMSRRVSPLAGFQVTIIGRFWVTTEVNRPPSPSVSQANLSTTEINFLESHPAVEGTATEGNGVPTIVVGHDRIISHPMILLIEHGHFAEVSSGSEAFRLGSPGGSLTAMYIVRDGLRQYRP
jgi:hypothetical protein